MKVDSLLKSDAEGQRQRKRPIRKSVAVPLMLQRLDEEVGPEVKKKKTSKEKKISDESKKEDKKPEKESKWNDGRKRTKFQAPIYKRQTLDVISRVMFPFM